jgi:hypothetical protein
MIMAEQENSNPMEVPEALHQAFDISKDVNGFANANNAAVADTLRGFSAESAAAGDAAEASEFAEGAEGMMGSASSFFEAAEPVAGAAGAFLGGFNVAKGVDEMFNGEAGQGTLDVAAGGLGIAAGAGAMGVEALGAAACPMLAPAALAAGLIASGNEKAKEWGVFGTETDENGNTVNRDAIDWVGDETSAAYTSVDDALGGGVLGAIGGGLAGGVTAIGTGLAGAAVDLGAGIVGVGESIASGIGAIFSW